MKKIFWGLIFLFFDFYISLNTNVLHLLPNFVGYCLILYGVNEIKNFIGDETSVPEWFSKITIACKIMCAVGAVHFLKELLGIRNLDIDSLFSLVFLGGNLFITFFITEIVFTLQGRYSMPLNGDFLRKVWKICAVISCLSTATLFFMPLLSGFFGIANSVCAIIFTVYFYKSQKVFGSTAGV